MCTRTHKIIIKEWNRRYVEERKSPDIDSFGTELPKVFGVTGLMSLGGETMVHETLQNRERNQLASENIYGNKCQIEGIVHKNKPANSKNLKKKNQPPTTRKQINFPLLGSIFKISAKEMLSIYLLPLNAKM